MMRTRATTLERRLGGDGALGGSGSTIMRFSNLPRERWRGGLRRREVPSCVRSPRTGESRGPWLAQRRGAGALFDRRRYEITPFERE